MSTYLLVEYLCL